MRKFVVVMLGGLILFANAVKLTDKESSFIKNRTFTCVTTSSWAPFNTLKNGKLAGISIDFWNLIKQKLHLKTKCIIKNSWTDVLNTIKTQKADISLGTDITPKKERFAIFTKPYADFPIAIATRNDVGFIASMNFLKNKTIAVCKNYTATHILQQHYPHLKYLYTDNIKQSLEAVSNNKAYAAIDIMPVLVYNINKYEFANLKIAGKTPWFFRIRFMLSKNNRPLAGAINKAIDTISTDQKQKIYKKWVHVTSQEGYTLKQILCLIISFLFIILMLFYWIKSLKKELKKRELIEKELQKLSIIDSLTGIFNRYKIDTTLKKQISFAKRNKTPLSIIFFDIDHFKKINDTYGHKMGDEILKELVNIIKNILREYDIFGRWGGEEFIIILPNTSLIQAIKVAQKIKSEIEKHSFKKIDRLTCSFGVTELTEHDTNDSILIRVDDYMYQAKKRGRNNIVSDLNQKF